MKRMALWAIRGYQRTLSRVLPPACRFVPSCSDYAYEAIERHGLARGMQLAVWRVLRCNPWGGHGYDPVPAAADSAPPADHTPVGVAPTHADSILPRSSTSMVHRNAPGQSPRWEG